VTDVAESIGLSDMFKYRLNLLTPTVAIL